MGVDATQKNLAQAKARYINAKPARVFEGYWNTTIEILRVDSLQIGKFDYSSIIILHRCF